MWVEAGPLEAIDPWTGRKAGGTHLADTCFRLTDLCMAMATATFTCAQVESTGHACVARVTVLGARRLGGSRALLVRSPFRAVPMGWWGWVGPGED